MRKLRAVGLAAAVGAALTASVALAANPAALDTSFSGDGTRKLGFGFSPHNDFADDVVTTPAGKVVAAGFSTLSPADTGLAVARLGENSKPDVGFSGDGRRVVNFGPGDDQAHGVALQRDGKVVVVGYTATGSNVYQAAITRLTAGGRIDRTFAGDGKRITGFGGDDDEFFSASVLPSGKIVAVGLHIAGNTSRFAVARYLPDGSFDHSFSNDGKRLVPFETPEAEATALAVDDHGRLILAGRAASGSISHFAVARLHSNGALDTTFSHDGRRVVSFAPTDASSATAVALDPSGRIVVAGFLFSGGGSNIAVARLRPGGVLDSAFSSDGKRLDQPGTNFSSAADVAVQPSGKVLVAGVSDPSAPDDSDFVLMRYRANGTRDPSFSGDGIRFTPVETHSHARANGIALDRDGRIVLAGSIDDDGGNTSFAFARYRGGP